MNFLNGDMVGGNRCEIQQSDMIYMYAKVQFQTIQGRIQDFKLEGAHLKKFEPSRGSNENFWGISCEKSRFYAKKSYFFQF
jgi:hypothetical protein